MPDKIYRGEMYYADLNPVIGSEQGGLRPVLIIQNNTGNFHSPTVIVAAISGRINEKPNLPTHHKVRAYAGLKEESLVLLEQIRTIDKKRLQEYIGKLNRADMKQVDRCLAISLALKAGNRAGE
ncbi:MAG: type II toxin-antitoxin system PemK/MazF family toxin [Clostridium sp.]|nr:type II toxin-antitoxin system PemK/MazF family toxin [Clostridium sp.]MCM1224328.1 type II toxin-antitoxin system PemK/MazF family toxin [Lachnospiraceae bacterium]